MSARALLQLAAVVVAVAAAAGIGRAPAPRLVAAATAGSGPVAIGNSGAGTAVVTATNVVPGGGAAGRVTITNAGSVAADVDLRLAIIAETPGRGGGRLSAGGVLEVQDATGATPRTVYRGAPAALGTLALGTWARGESHTYTIALRLPDGGAPSSPTTGDNRLQAAALRFDLTWTATQHPGPPPR